MVIDMKSPATLTAPKHLRADTAAWWLSVCADYQLEEHHRRLLTLAGEAWDRCREARELIKKDGMVAADRFGQLKPHPGVNIERDARIGFARLLRELCLDIEPPADARPPRRGGM